jgi:hypothetical protein
MRHRVGHRLIVTLGTNAWPSPLVAARPPGIEPDQPSRMLRGGRYCRGMAHAEWPDEVLEILDSSEWQTREVYARYGSAMYFSNCVEAQLANYILILRIARNGGPITRKEIEALEARILSGTFGQNLGEVRDLLGGDWALADEMAELLELRNHLAHHWWRERISEIGTSKRRAALIDELEGIRELMEAGDAKLVERCKRMHKRIGLPENMIETEYAKLMMEYTVDPPDDEVAK